MTTIFVRQRKPSQRREQDKLVPDSFFSRYGADTAIVEKNPFLPNGIRITTYTEIGERKKQKQRDNIERKHRSDTEIRAAYLWVFWCPGFAFMGWWAYLKGLGWESNKWNAHWVASQGMRLFPEPQLFSTEDSWKEWFASNFRKGSWAREPQGKAKVWVRLYRGLCEKVAINRVELEFD